MARTIYSEFISDLGTKYRISLIGSAVGYLVTEDNDVITSEAADLLGFNGLAEFTQEVTADGQGFTLSYEGDDNNRFEEFKESSVSWGFYVPNDAVENFLFDLEDDDDNSYYITIEEDVNNTWTRRWVGPLELGNASWEDSGYPYRYELVATDGLAQLGDVMYNDPINNPSLEDPATRTFPAMDYIVSALNSIKGADEFDGQDMIATYLNLYEENILPTSVTNSNLIQTDVLNNIYLDHLAFTQIKLEDSSALEVVKSPTKQQLEAITQLEVLRNIMRVFGCRLYLNFETGLWTIDEIGAWANRATGQFLIYDFEGNLTGNDSMPAQLNFDNLQALSGGNTFFAEKYNSYSINYRHNISGIHMPDYAQHNGVDLRNPGASKTAALAFYNTEYTIGSVAYGNGQNTFSLQLNLRAAASSTSYIGDTAWLTVLCYIEDTIGGQNYYLENSQGVLKWSTDSTDRCNTSQKFPQPVAPVAPSVLDFNMNLICPPIPTTGILKFKINTNNFKNKVIGLSAANIKAITYSDGEQFDYTEFRASKVTANNREVNYIAGEVSIGDGPFWFSPSALLWHDGTNYQQTSDWIDRKQAIQGSTTYYPILDIMSQYALDAFSNNRRVMEISFRDNFGPSRLLQRGSRVYRPTSLSFSATAHIWSTTQNHIGLASASGTDLGDNPVDTGFIGGSSTTIVSFAPSDLSDDKTNIVSLDGGSIGISFNGGNDNRGGAEGYRPTGDNPVSLIDPNYGNSTN